MSAAEHVQADDLASQSEEHRAGLIAHCYRMLGSFHDAEDATQEALLRAWRKRDGFRGEASLKTWLYRIATRVCLDLMRSRARRLTPASVAGPAIPTLPPKAPVTEISWLEPLPTEAARTDLDPAAAYSQTESVKLAFIAALQALTPGQRAVLILRDVLAWSTAETAETLGLSEPAASSALHRARQRLRQTYHPAGVDAFPGPEPEDPRVRTMLAAYVDAWRRSDVDGLVETLRTDVRIAMPPSPSWYRGRDDVLEVLRTWVWSRGEFQLRAASYNAQPAFQTWLVGPGPEIHFAIQVLVVDRDGISAIDFFVPGPSLTNDHAIGSQPVLRAHVRGGASRA